MGHLALSSLRPAAAALDAQRGFPLARGLEDPRSPAAGREDRPERGIGGCGQTDVRFRVDHGGKVSGARLIIDGAGEAGNQRFWRSMYAQGVFAGVGR